MWTVSFLLLVLAIGMESLDCPIGQQPCGSIACFDPTIQGCNNDNTTLQCLNACNGICYSNSQYCYNNTLICNNGDLVCDIGTYNSLSEFSSSPTCYDPSQSRCYNNTLCANRYICGTQCIDLSSACANNQTICYGVPFIFYDLGLTTYDVCGPQQQCYDIGVSVCLNGTTICPGLNAQLCGTHCFNPDLNVCINGTIQCPYSCNGICYSNSQYCYNNTLICNNGDLVCDIGTYNSLSEFSSSPTCYDPSQSRCYNNTLCANRYICGTQCIDLSSACANNQTICYGVPFIFYDLGLTTYGVCGPQQQCYDIGVSVCLNGTTICPGLNAQLCGRDCFNPDLNVCINGTIQCPYSCNGICYSNSQYCYNNTLICNNGDLVCDIGTYNSLSEFSSSPTCYDPSQSRCYNNTLCANRYICGTQCIDLSSACANNQTICYGVPFIFYDLGLTIYGVCGPQQQCYDIGASVCVGNNGTVCPIGNQLCSDLCYDPRLQYCTGGNNTIYCLNNPSEPNCLLTSTEQISPTSSATTSIAITATSGCCAVQSCTQNSDCCEPASSECQCYRHIQTDVYGTCVNPYTTPICGDSCPVQGKCISDSDCCKCQCANVSFTDQDGNLLSKKQCVRR